MPATSPVAWSRSTSSARLTCATRACARTPLDCARSLTCWASCATPGPRSPSVMDLGPYEELVALAESERALALDGRWGELSDLLDRRGAVMAALPAQDPEAARPLLARALAAHAQAHA